VFVCSEIAILGFDYNCKQNRKGLHFSRLLTVVQYAVATSLQKLEAAIQAVSEYVNNFISVDSQLFVNTECMLQSADNYIRHGWE
jgi:GTP cyclohydrolase FolE2